MGSRNRRTLRAALAIACLGLLVGVQLPTAAAARRTTQDSAKEQSYSRLIQVDESINSIRGQLAADPTNTRLQTRLANLTAEYEALSVQFGGDRAPGNFYVDNTPQRGNVTPIPPGCTSATASGSNNTPQNIPDNNPTGITSTINISGAGTYLWDVDLQTFITHTFPGDIDMTLTSPAGTTITVSTDNGGSNDNAFNGTLWTDDAGATNPPGSANDNTYAVGVTESPLAPEEGFAALRGQNPNGTWTLMIADDAAADTGALNSWNLLITTLASAPIDSAPITGSNNTPQAILDNATITSTINIVGSGFICDVDLQTFITHTFPGDIDMTLTSPAGTSVTISTDNGGSNDNAFNGTVWTDDAGATNPPGPASDNTYAIGVTETPLAPEEPMAAFRGENPNGTWTLMIADDAGGDTGALNSWNLSIVTCSCQVVQGCVITCPAPVNVPATSPSGAVVTYPAPTTSGTCGPITCAPASGSMFPVGTTTVTCTESAGTTTTTTTVYSSGNVAVPIPDNTPGGASVTINVPDSGTVTDVNVRVRLNHTFDSDLAIGLSHGNSGNALSNNNGGSGDNYGTGTNDCAGTKTIFDDQAVTPISSGTAPFAGSFQPQSGLSIYNGSDAAGAWTLKVVDSVGLDSGTIGCFELEITRQVSVQTMNSCTFPVTVAIPFDGCCVDDYTGDVFQTVVANATPGSPLYGFWQYTVAATGETFSGTSNYVAYRPGLSLVERDTDSATVAMYAQIDFVRHTCLVQVTDRTTGRQFTLRDRNITNSTCGAAPAKQSTTQ
jgi:subtilisin-like proprotein convertase family protein